MKKINKNLECIKMYTKGLNKKETGITLIALVVTIIVLLILAGVTLSIALNNEGLISRARQAKTTYLQGEQNDIKALNALEDYYEEYVEDGVYTIIEKDGVVYLGDNEKIATRDQSRISNICTTFDEAYVVIDDNRVDVTSYIESCNNDHDEEINYLYLGSLRSSNIIKDHETYQFILVKNNKNYRKTITVETK